jgi:superoxide dismutase, Cu-Zn family
MVRSLVLLMGAALVLTGCERAPERQPQAGEIAAGPQPGLQVVVEPVSGSTVSGRLAVSQTSDGVTIRGRLSGLPADRRLGFHVHERGDCAAPASGSAGNHFNPDQLPHGNPDGDRHHAGDMPNLDVDSQGVADVDVTLNGLVIDGPAARSIRQRAVVVHAQADDYETQPSGASGDVIACGVISADDAR